MSNKKQINLKTITLDWPTALYNSQHLEPRTIRPKRSLLITSRSPSRTPASTSSALLGSQPPNSKNNRILKKQNACLNKFKNLEINRYKISSFLDIKNHMVEHSLHQKFPKREPIYKNSNAYRFYIDSEPAAHRSYTESIAAFQLMHYKLSDNNLQKVKITRPQTCKSRLDTDQSKQTINKNTHRKRVQSSSVFRKDDKVKGKRCVTVPQFTPWETVEDKILTEW